MATHSVFLPGKSHGQRSLAGYSPWGHKELDTTDHTHIHTHMHLVSTLKKAPKLLGFRQARSLVSGRETSLCPGSSLWLLSLPFLGEPLLMRPQSS